MGSKPIVGVVSKMAKAIESDTREKNLNGVQRFPGAMLLDLCTSCSPGDEMNAVWSFLGFGIVLLVIFFAGMFLQVKKWNAEKPHDDGKSKREPVPG